MAGIKYTKGAEFHAEDKMGILNVVEANLNFYLQRVPKEKRPLEMEFKIIPDGEKFKVIYIGHYEMKGE